MKQYIVNVGNIGNIDCTTKEQAIVLFNDYVTQSKNNIGRAAGEDVCIFEDGEPIMEYWGTLNETE